MLMFYVESASVFIGKVCCHMEFRYKFKSITTMIKVGRNVIRI